MSTHTTTDHAELRRTDGANHLLRRASSGFVVPAHGGAGATTLAAHPAIREHLRESDVAQSVADLGDGDVDFVVVAHLTAHGTARASTTVQQLELAGIEAGRIHVAVVRDGRGPTPVAARARLRLLSQAVADITVFPHVLRWRYESAGVVDGSRAFNRAAHLLAERLAIPNQNAFERQTTELTPGELR